MARYNIRITLRSGQGTALIDGLPIDPDGYEEGTILTFNWKTDATYTNISVSTRGSYIPLQNTASFEFTMPSRDVEFSVRLSNWVITTVEYGLKYFYEFGTTQNECKRIEILERDYSGPSEVRQLNNVIRRFGDRNSDPTRTFIFSSMDVTFVASNTEYYEFITGDVRKFQLILKYGDDIKFKGYIKPDFITSPEHTNVNHEIRLTAFDGLDDFGAIRLELEKIPRRLPIEGFAPFSQEAIKLIALCLNQTFQEGRRINISCDLYEERMDPDTGMFEQWAYGENAVFNDGENPRFVEDRTNRVVNEYLTLEEVLTRVLNPFICNVFIWEDEFYIIRVEELIKPQIRFFKYEADSEFIESFVLNNDQSDDCILANGLRTGRAVYTRFTASLRLGVFLPEVKTGQFDYRFDRLQWRQGRDITTDEITYILRYWDYINSTVYLPTSQTPQTGDVAGIAYVTEGGESCRIYTTTTDAGLSDPNLSYIERVLRNAGTQQTRNGQDEAFIPFEIATVLTFDADWKYGRRIPNVQSNPGNLRVAFQIQVGDYYLIQSGSFFEWTLTPNIINFAINAPIGITNEIRLFTDPLPVGGEVLVRLYQLINTGGNKDNYFIDWDFAKVDIQQNQALTLNEIQKQFNTFATYSKVYPIYKTYLGDSISNQSTSAMRLLDGEVTERWGEDEVGLLDNLVQSLANMFGRSNVSVFGNMVRTIWDPFKALQYKGRYWKINHMVINETIGEVSNIDLFDLGEIGEPETDFTISWQTIESPPYIDANMRIFVNEVLRVEEWSNNTGVVPVQTGDNIRIQYFFLANLIDPGMVNPTLQLIVDGDIIGNHPITPTETQTHNHYLTVMSDNISILVQSIEVP